MLVNRYRPDYAGFVFAESKRCLTKETAARLKRILSLSIPAVGVFVRAPKEMICQLVKNGIIDLVQLHGGEDDSYVAELKEQLNCPVIRAVHVKESQPYPETADGQKELESEIVRLMQQMNQSADYLLFDTDTAGVRGGSGRMFERTALREALQRVRMRGQKIPEIFLAGGLNVQNVKEAVQDLQPFAVDISSGVETEGKKDERKLARLMEELGRG